MSLAAEISSGDRRRALAALRDKIAGEIEAPDTECGACGRAGVHPRDLAALVRRLQAVIAELDELPTERRGTPVDEIARRRAARQAAANVQPGAGVRDKRR